MSDAYDVRYFEPDYCEKDLSSLADAMHNLTSILLIGMPGCGKGRLFDFLLHKPGILEQYGLSDNWRVVLIDGDAVGGNAAAIYSELLFALRGTRTDSGASLNSLRNELRSAVEQLEPNTHLGVIFDNFTRDLQSALDKDFFNYLFALRNGRPRLNIVYVFVVNLTVDVAGFYRLERLFDGGIDRSLRWLSCFNRKDAFFSMDRQLRKVGEEPDVLSEEQKERIYHLGGGHALLNRHLTHLMLTGQISMQSSPTQVLAYAGIRAACEAIWNDLKPAYQNWLIDLRGKELCVADAPDEILWKYGVVNDQGEFFSPLFEQFVKSQRKAPVVFDLRYDESCGAIVIRKVDCTDVAVSLRGLTARQRWLLRYLLENRGNCCSKDELIRVGWPSAYEIGDTRTEQALVREVKQIRRWIDDQELLCQLVEIKAVYGEGYELALKG
jgi:hypothetical protein